MGAVRLRAINTLVLASIFLVLQSGACPTAQARVVGLVVDDSGSMANRFETPLYVAQLLISVLGPEDRLFITRISGKGVIQEVDLRRREEHMESMRKHWRVLQGTQTPYSPVEEMIERLIQVTKKGEEANFLIVTDGEFTQDVRPPDALRSQYESYRNQFKGESLQAFFVAFAPRSPDGDKVLQTIQSQRVRENLLKVFNGREDIGSVIVREGRELYGALADIIALMVGVDPRQTDDAFEAADKYLKIKVPFTVTRLVAISSGSQDLPEVKLVQENFQTRQRETYTASMRKADSLTTKLLAAQVYYLTPWPSLAPGGDYILTFDKTVRRADLRMLFETSVKVEWEIYDEAGRLLPVDPNGAVEVAQRQRVKIRAFLIEPRNGKEEQVEFSQLRRLPEFSLHCQGLGKDADTSVMSVDKAASTATATLSFDQPGRYTAAVTARYPGFINKRARDLTVVVREELPVDITISAAGTGVCPNCTSDRVALTYTMQEAYQEVLAISVKCSAAREGEYEIGLSEPLPRGVQILFSDRKQIRGGSSSNTAISCSAAKPQQLFVQYNKDYTEPSEKNVLLSVKAKPPFKGEAHISLRFVPLVADLRLEPAGSTLDHSGKEPFRLKVTSLGQGHGAYIKAIGILAPLDPAHVRFEGEDIPFEMHVEKGTNSILVVPKKKGWCDCLTPAGKHVFKVSYRHPVTKQQASYSGTVELLPVGLWEECWQEILGTIITILTLLKLWCLARTHRFPRHSCLSVEPDDQPYNKEEVKLHRWRDYFATLCGNARRSAHGFNLEAADDSLLLRYEKWYHSSLVYGAQSLSSLFENNELRPISIAWGDVIRDKTKRYTYRFIEDIRKSES